ncbi:hypothetical protein [Lactococcus lactis]|uniref:hypothetical protein n=1 Tax=Lactococcus lactis TaxID=1358 RepID=UPI00163DDC5C|nr:hypothetical protein [Lactococcus lactis]
MQAKEKALEEQRKIDADRITRENSQTTDQADVKATQETNRGIVTRHEAINGNIGFEWSSVSPEQASQYMASKTGVSAGKWLDVIYKESSGNPYSDKKANSIILRVVK